MSKTSTQSLSQKRTMSTKLVMGLMVAAVSVLVGTANVANATPGQSGNNTGYGGDININIGDIVGDNNTIVIIVNYLVGNQ
ncbi:MAG TPA: hypothetical protein VK497_03545 [Candidatus Saccharimonadales bacterium]|nr:hypothetical protein [Candidatus Saccharimonadales bacterium]